MNEFNGSRPIISKDFWSFGLIYLFNCLFIYLFHQELELFLRSPFYSAVYQDLSKGHFPKLNFILKVKRERVYKGSSSKKVQYFWIDRLVYLFVCLFHQDLGLVVWCDIGMCKNQSLSDWIILRYVKSTCFLNDLVWILLISCNFWNELFKFELNHRWVMGNCFGLFYFFC